MVAAVAEAHRRDWTQVLATTALLTHDLDLAEECTQDAYEQALRAWPDHGIPDRPGAWLTTTARNRARDVLRRESAFRRAMPLLVPEQTEPGPETGFGDDGRLRLIFTCCHPALSGDAQIALTLRLVCGLSTAEVARAFLVREPTMAARITRAKKKISAARIPYRVPSPDQLDERVSVVLEVVHLIFTTGHTAPEGPRLARRDLVDSAISLARLLHLLMPTQADISALLALLLLIDARAQTRVSADGRLLLLSEQDRTRWDRQLIGEGTGLLTDALRRGGPTRYAVEAAIAATHAEARPGRTPTGPRSPRCMRSCAGSGLPRWSSSTGRSRSACGTARRPAWTRWRRSWPTRRWPPTATSARPGPTSCASSGTGPRRRRPTRRPSP